MKVKDGNHHGDDQTGFLGGTVIELFAESGNVHAMLAQSGTDRRCGRCLAGRNLQLNVSLYFLCHLSGTSIKIVVERKRLASSHVAPRQRTGRCMGTASKGCSLCN